MGRALEIAPLSPGFFVLSKESEFDCNATPCQLKPPVEMLFIDYSKMSPGIFSSLCVHQGNTGVFVASLLITEFSVRN